MWHAVKRVAPGLLLIALTATILLVADRAARTPVSSPVPNIAILKFVSHPSLDDVEHGILAGLEQRGFVVDKTIHVRVLNAEGDMTTANSMARAIVDGNYALVVTITTPCLQAMANANKTRQLPHVFGSVTDPFSAGVGVTRTSHPPYLTGIGSFDPVEDVFDLARRLCPELRKVGVVWNPAEACSQACLAKARPRCQKLGLELLEANVENTSGVKEAVASVVGRGAEAVWMTADNTVAAGAPTVLAVAQEARLPVFSNEPARVSDGVLFAIGADYFQVGQATGELAGKVLAGRNDPKGLKPADVPVKDVLPRQLAVNLSALRNLKGSWTVDRETQDQAAILFDERGAKVRGLKPAAASGQPSNSAKGAPQSDGH